MEGRGDFMALNYPPGLTDRIAQVLSEILTDKYGEEYGVKITSRFVSKEGGDEDDRNQTAVC